MLHYLLFNSKNREVDLESLIKQLLTVLIYNFNPRLPKGVVATPCNFFLTIAKRLYVIYTNPITHIFTKMNRNLVRGVVKVFGRALGETL